MPTKRKHGIPDDSVTVEHEDKSQEKRKRKEKKEKKEKGKGKDDVETRKRPRERDGKKVEEVKAKDTEEQDAKKLKSDEAFSVAKLWWERIRAKNTAKNERKDLCQQMVDLLKGRYIEIMRKHDGSRILQSIIKFGTVEQREAVWEELKGHIVELSLDKYARYVVFALLRFSKEHKVDVAKEMQGHVLHLARSKYGSTVLEFAYSNVTTIAQRNSMIREFYGPLITLVPEFEVGTPSLGRYMHALPEKRATIMKSLWEYLSGVVSKGIVAHTILHKVFYEFFMVASKDMADDLISSLAEHGPDLLMHDDPAGISCVLFILANGSTEARDSMISSLEGYAVELATTKNAYAALLGLMKTISDEEQLVQHIVEPLFDEENVESLARDMHGKLAFLFSICPGNRRYFSIPTLSMVKGQPLYRDAEYTTDKLTWDDMEGVEIVPTEQSELLKSIFLPRLQAFLLKEEEEEEEEEKEEEEGKTEEKKKKEKKKSILNRMLLDSAGADVVFETANASSGAERRSIMTKIADLCGDMPDGEFISDFTVRRGIRRLLLIDSSVKSQASLGSFMWSKIKANISAWATHKDGSFIMMELAKSPAVGNAVIRRLKQAQVKKAMSECDEELKGPAALLEFVTNAKA